MRALRRPCPRDRRQPPARGTVRRPEGVPSGTRRTPVSVTTPVPRARRADLVVLSHLRWGSVYQRPHHLMSRASREGRVYWVEEPVVGSAPGIGFEHVRDG